MTYEIYEDGCHFATIEEVDSAEEALDIAEEDYPRHAPDYNGYTGPIIWRACEPGRPFEASKTVEVS